MTGPGPVSVVLADDAPLIRSGVALVLESAGLQVLARVGDADELCRAVQALCPDVVLTDVRMPPSHTVEGLRAAGWVQRNFPDTGVLLLSNHAETRHLQTLLDSATAGVGYLLKERVVDTAAFVAAVRTVAGGGNALDPEVVRLLLSRRPGRAATAVLTDREREVLATMAAGASNAALARRLTLSPKTVEAHIASIFRKLGLYDDADEHRRVRAVLAYLQAGPADPG